MLTGLRKHLKYASYVARHKVFVLIECVRLGVPIAQALAHDWHKFTWSEWFAYANFFYAPKVREPTVTGDAAFDMAWLRHQKRGKHHWQWWCVPSERGNSYTGTQEDSSRCHDSTSTGKGRSSASDADSSGPSQTSLTRLGSTGSCAKSTGQGTAPSSESAVARSSAPTIESDTPATQKPAGSVPGKPDDAGGVKFSAITAESRQPARVAGKTQRSSSASTTSTAAGQSTASSSRRRARRSIGGSLRRAFLRVCGCSATTATRLPPTTERVPISDRILPEDDGGQKVLPMPDRYRREMLADWRGAGRAQGFGNDVSSWYAKNRDKMVLHPETRAWIDEQLR